jgi:hypothetical protein
MGVEERKNVVTICKNAKKSASRIGVVMGGLIRTIGKVLYMISTIGIL